MRTTFARVTQHVNQGGSPWEGVFFGDYDGGVYLTHAKEYCERHDVDIASNCLLTSHRLRAQAN
ncbi:MAG: hypothetical protein ACE5NW_07660 [Acidiferrobacterales bacterium]